MTGSHLPRTTERPVREHGDECSELPAREVSQSHGRKSVVRGLPTSKSTLMVVDDNPDLVTIIRVMLADKVNVRYAYSGPQLFAGLEEEKTDLIIIDVMLPQMDGLEVLRRLKGAPETSSIPVILITALDRYVNKLTGCKMGADEYITKPFTRTQLITSINRLLNGDQGHSLESLNKDKWDNVLD